ncbi:MAG: hypothetical protein SH819_01140 [Cytophagales bacterium]|nr:hypothetical protein [Cytophagales bacterium]
MRYLIAFLLLTSCSPLYLPGTRNTPLFREQGEAQLSGFISGAGAEAQVAYALTDNVAVTGSFSYASQKKTNPDYDRKNLFGEVGLGYYGRSRSVRYELFAGYGMGQSTNYDVYYFFAPFFGQQVNVEATGKVQRIFFQPSIGTNNRGTNIFFTPRISWVDFSEFTSGAISVKPAESPKLYLEPAATLKFHLAGNLYGIFQLGLTVPMGDTFYTYQPLTASIGLQIDTGGLGTKVYK